MHLKLKSALYFLGYILISIITIYYLPKVFSTIWLTTLLVIYWNSDDEPFWMAFFLILSDGFMSFFGLYEATLQPFPGVPGIETSQFYILLTLLKSRLKNPNYPLFFKNNLVVLGIYLSILIVIGLTLGTGGDINILFRIIKSTLPFLLFISIPKLMKNSEDYSRFFAFVFPIAILALFSQFYKIFNSESLQMSLGAMEIVPDEIADSEIFRTLYNTNILLLAMFGSMFYLSKNDRTFNSYYLNFIIVVCIASAVFSATRGWTLGFIMALIFNVIFNFQIKPQRTIIFSGITLILFMVLLRIPQIDEQFNKAYERIMTVEKITEGDITADDTQVRTTERSPRILKHWQESPVLGYGYSKDYYRYYDMHVGNQNIMLHSGIIGLVLLVFFFLYFVYKMFEGSVLYHNKTLRVFVAFFIGWFFIHSTSVQQFGFSTIPSIFIGQAVFFCLGSYTLNQSKQAFYGKNLLED